MKKRTLCLLLICAVLLAGCAAGARVEQLHSWSIQHNDGSNDYSVFFGFLDEDGRAIAAGATAELRIENDEGEILYEQTRSVTPEDFSVYTSAARGEEFLAEIRINDEEVKAGKSRSGTLYLKVHTDDGGEFDEVNCELFYDLPTLDVTIETEALPQEIRLDDYMGDLASVIRIDQVEYAYSSDYSSSLTVTVYGVKLEQYSDLSLDCVTYKLMDSEGYVVDNGSFYLDGISAGDKFKDDSIWFYDLIPGETYTIVFSAEE